MADELESVRLTVVLTPGRRWGEPGMIRSVETENPNWYQKFCAQHASRRRDAYRWRKHKTSIKRAATVRALRAIAAGHVQKAKHFGAPAYAAWLRPLVQQQLTAQRRERRKILADIRRTVPF